MKLAGTATRDRWRRPGATEGRQREHFSRSARRANVALACASSGAAPLAASARTISGSGRRLNTAASSASRSTRLALSAGATFIAQRCGGQAFAGQRRAFQKIERALAAHLFDHFQHARRRHGMAGEFSGDDEPRGRIRLCDQAQHGLFKLRKLLGGMILPRNEMICRDAQKDALPSRRSRPCLETRTKGRETGRLVRHDRLRSVNDGVEYTN